jgi:hypothetical protein
MATFVAREGVLSLDKEQLAQLQAAGQEQALSGQSSTPCTNWRGISRRASRCISTRMMQR